jgi:hypothetical protein
MMYRISCDHRDSVPDRYQGGDKPLVFLVTTVRVIVDAGLRRVASDGNAATATSDFTTDLPTMTRMIDWPLMRAERWNSTTVRTPSEEPGERGTRPGAWIAVYSDRQMSQVGKVLSDHPLGQRIIVRPRWYYGLERR